MSGPSTPETRIQHDDIPEQALAWRRAGKGAALATVVQTWGSAPRQAGAQLAVSSDGELTGSVSGGCVEGAVTAEALEAIEDGKPRILEFGVSDDDAFAVGLACGGTIRIMVEPVDVGDGVSSEFLAELTTHRAERRAVVAAVDTKTWARELIDASEPVERERARDGVSAIVAGKSRFSESDPDWFLAVHAPPLRMAVIGAVHISQALATMARLSGYDVTLIDPRLAFASEARFPGETLSHQWPDAALEQLGLDPHTAVVCLTHDAKLDDPALIRALRSDAFYVGALGSPRTHAKRVERLKAEGLTDAEIGRLHAPIGLDIGAKSPAEIAVSILAQITERLRRPETRSGMATR
ncbi:MAG: XdhC/CoxI family protein [Pseudomonadota bacterium]